jgi:hypothetical protein
LLLRVSFNKGKIPLWKPEKIFIFVTDFDKAGCFYLPLKQFRFALLFILELNYSPYFSLNRFGLT